VADSAVKSTVTLCYHQSPTGESCKEKVQWQLKGSRTFRVCDKHLAWGLRFSGLPARVDEYPVKDK